MRRSNFVAGASRIFPATSPTGSLLGINFNSFKSTYTGLPIATTLHDQLEDKPELPATLRAAGPSVEPSDISDEARPITSCGIASSLKILTKTPSDFVHGSSLGKQWQHAPERDMLYIHSENCIALMSFIVGQQLTWSGSREIITEFGSQSSVSEYPAGLKCL